MPRILRPIRLIPCNLSIKSKKHVYLSLQFTLHMQTTSTMKYGLSLLLTLWATLCLQAQSCKIVGQTGSLEAEGKIVRLMLIEQNYQVVDSAVVINGKFHLQAQVPRPCWAYVDIEESDNAYLIIEGGTLRLTIDEESFNVVGAPLNQIFHRGWRRFLQEERRLLEEKETIVMKSTGKEDYLRLWEEAQNRSNQTTKALILDIIKQNQGNIVPVFWIYTFLNLFTKAEIEAAILHADPALKQNPLLLELLKELSTHSPS